MEYKSYFLTLFGFYDLIMSFILGALFIRPLRQLLMKTEENSEILHHNASELQSETDTEIELAASSSKAHGQARIVSTSGNGLTSSTSAGGQTFRRLIIKYSILTSVAALSTLIMVFLVGVLNIIPAGAMNGAVDSFCLLLMSDAIYDGLYRKVCKFAIDFVHWRWSNR